MLLPFLLFSLALGAPPQSTHKQSDQIDKPELSIYLAKLYDCEPGQMHFGSIDYYDFLKKGYDQTVVVASTCMTGTAGPDVHSVFTRDANGELKELQIEEYEKLPPVLFGNANSGFRIEDGLLVAFYWDSSGRDNPLVIKYNWDEAKQQFAIVKVFIAPRYPTSYSCDKAVEEGDETAQAICYVKTLADLDLDMEAIYRTYLELLHSNERKNAIEEQRSWLKERNKRCVIYKFWVDCLQESYDSRITDLQKKTEEQKQNSTTTKTGKS